MTALLFEEHQSFRQAWLWAIMLSLLAATGVLVALAPAREGQMASWVGLAIMLAAVLLLFSMRMTVQVDPKFIRIRFFPLWKKTIALNDVSAFEARTYGPLLEYGGWGIRYGLGNGWAYNVRGNRGVQLELADGKRILIGSQRAEELARAIGEAKRLA
jgi:hypothetical protein